MANTSLTITFVTEEKNLENNASIQARLDDEYNKDEEGEAINQFLYGSKAYYQVFTSPEDLVLTQVQSDGTISPEGSGTAEIEEFIHFVDSYESNVTYPVRSIISSEWLGTNLGAVSVEGDKIKSSQKGVGVLKITYSAYFRRFALSLSTRDEEVYYVMIYISGGSADAD